MRELTIEWKHLDKEGETCLRCSETGKTLNQVISELSNELESKGIKVNFTETKLSEKDIAQSNIILFNGLPLENVLSDVKVVENSCPSCSAIVGKSTCCRAVKHKNEIYEEIPSSMIRRAALKVIDSK